VTSRRQFLPYLALPFAAKAQDSKCRIEAIEIHELQGTREAERGMNGQYQVQPLHIYPSRQPNVYQDSPAPSRGPRRTVALYLKLKATGGLEGLYGPIDREVAIVIDQQLRGFLKGKDGLAGDTAWDQLYRLNRHSRGGHFLMAISAIDNALWDLRGRYFNAPVYRLLGGPSRTEVEFYGSTLGSTLEPGKLQERAKFLFAQGFRNQKWFLADGPARGPEGFERNVRVMQLLREALGPSAGIMFDVFNGWDLPYALKWCKEVEALRPRWLEEPFSSEKVDAYTRLSASTSVPIATGEHFYGRWEVHQFLKADAIRVVQADPEWCGGVSELKRICTIASLYDVPVIPHGHNVHASLHTIASEPPTTCPLGEYLVLKMGSYYHFDRHDPKPSGGKLKLSERPGFGMEIDTSKVEKSRILTWTA
jgi:L-rhamnonate dehydratase